MRKTWVRRRLPSFRRSGPPCRSPPGPRPGSTSIRRNGSASPGSACERTLDAVVVSGEAVVGHPDPARYACATGPVPASRMTRRKGSHWLADWAEPERREPADPRGRPGRLPRRTRGRPGGFELSHPVGRCHSPNRWRDRRITPAIVACRRSLGRRVRPPGGRTTASLPSLSNSVMPDRVCGLCKLPAILRCGQSASSNDTIAWTATI